MKKMRIVSGLLAMALAAVSFGTTAFAADNVQVKVGTDTVKAGDNFSVDVELASVPSSGLSSIDFAINYDKDVLKITDVKLGTVGDTGAKAAEGDLGDTLFNWYDNGKQIVIVWATGLTDSKYWISKDGLFLTITGTASASAANGTESKLTVAAADRAVYPGATEKASTYFSAVGADGKTTDYTGSFTNGSVKIGDSAPSGGDDAKWGDADCNGEVDVADVVLIARFCAEEEGADLSAQGKKNADVTTHSSKVDVDDATMILKSIAKLIPESDLAPKA
ncbi:MAG: cohesin domain-containing protein [Oscillospiraceae bacterium]|nr:cohesin domain-containing protein [Oscillospiraceae bacterium]